MSGMFFHVLWIVFAFGDLSGSLSCFIVSCPSHFWFSSSLVSFLSTAALRMTLIACGLSLSMISVLLLAIIIVPTSLKLHSKLDSVANLVACLKIDFLPFMILFISSICARLSLLSVELLRYFASLIVVILYISTLFRPLPPISSGR